MKLYGVYGAGGFGREVMPLLRRQTIADPNVLCVFIDDTVKGKSINGHLCMTFAEFLGFPAEKRAVTLAIADGHIRRRLAENCRTSDVTFISIRAENSITLDDSSAGDGLVLCGFATISSNTKIGQHFHGNLYSYLAHDCIVGDYVTFAPRATCSGNVCIEDDVYVGAGAIIRQGTADKPLTIGTGAVVGMGAVVTKDVPPGITVVGNPARPLVKQ